jgi:tRNA/rRNA methyltransferase
MAFFTYILQCADRSFYTGHTDDLEKRITQHETGALRGYTYDRRPVELMWVQEFSSREEALSAEIKVKNWSRAKKEALIAKDWDRLKLYSRPPSERYGLAHARHSPSTSLGRNGVGLVDPREAAHPVIVLVRPQLGENIGKAARAMLNFGLTELRLVTPRDGWPNPSAGPAAAGADLVLERAAVHESLADAVADCANVYATTVRKRGVSKPVLTPEEAAREIHRQPGRSAFVFGPERSGLETDDVALARAIVTVPINPEFGSLNLAQAVILCAYEWSKHVGLAQPTTEELLPPAPQEELEGMIAQLEGMLEPRGYYFPHSRAEATRRTLRSMMTKPGWNHLEVRTFRGVLSTLRRKPEVGGPDDA